MPKLRLRDSPARGPRQHLCRGAGWLLLAGLAALLLAAAIRERDLVRRTAAEGLGQDLKYSVISVYSLILAGPRDTADLVPIAHADVNPYSINVFFEQEVEEAKIRRSMEMIRDAGFTSIKQQVVWGEIEVPAKGRYGNHGETWAKYDRIVDLAREYGLGVILRLDTSPRWARYHSKKLESPPDDFRDYGDFVHAVVSRYRGRARYYQIWNEPNLAFEWSDVQPAPAEYAALLRIAYQRAKEADPNCVVISAALAPTLEESFTAMSDLRYLQGLYDAGARGSFDILGANAYGLRHGPDDWRLDVQRDVNFARPILLRETMVRNGDAGKPIWAAEVGWNALPPGFGEFPRYGAVSREQQASYTARAYLRAQEEWPWMGVMTLWHFRMIHESDAIQQQYYFNVVDAQLNPEPVYHSMKRLATSTPLLHRGYHQETHWALAFTPGWTIANDDRASLGGYAWSDDPNQGLTFQFDGTSLDLVVSRGPGFGRMTVTVDGQSLLATELVRSKGLANVEAGGPREEWQFVMPIARGLADGPHSVVVAPAGGRVAIDAVIVDGPWPYDRLRQRVLALILVIGGLGLHRPTRRLLVSAYRLVRRPPPVAAPATQAGREGQPC